MSLLTGIVNYWKYDDGSGSIVSETIASNNGVWLGTASWTTGIINGAGNFTGSNYVSASTAGVGFPLGAAARSISCWIHPTNITGTQVIYGYGTPTSKNTYGLYFSSGTILFWDWGGDINTSQTISAGVWTHLVTTYDGTNVMVYINGAANGPYADALNTATGNFAFGVAGPNGANQYFYDGKLDEVGIWNRALSQSEVTNLYNAGNGLQYPFGVVQYFSFEENSGSGVMWN